MQQHTSDIKFPTVLDLGIILSGQFGQSILPLLSNQPAFLTLSLTNKSLAAGFFLLKEGGTDSAENLNLVLKPGKKLQILVGTYPKQVLQSTELRGQLIIYQKKIEHKIKLYCRIQTPQIQCKKMLEDTKCNLKMIRLVVNKAVTSDVRIPLFNPEQYTLTLEAKLLIQSTIANKDNPFILKPLSTVIKVQPKQQFFVFINLQTNIGYKNDHKGLKKIVLRNVLTLRTNSAIFWCLPLEIIVVFVKHPSFKTQEQFSKFGKLY